jgi:uncharacterized membrane protein YGL010W
VSQPSLTPEMRSHVGQYNESHRTPVNRALHFVGIPLFVVATMGLFSKLSLSDGEGPATWQPNAGWIALFVASAVTLWWDWKTGLLATAVYVAGYALGSTLSAGVLWTLFGAGLVAHTVGHFGFEGKPPALFSHPLAVLEATPWLLSLWGGLYR